MDKENVLWIDKMKRMKSRERKVEKLGKIFCAVLSLFHQIKLHIIISMNEIRSKYRGHDKVVQR